MNPLHIMNHMVGDLAALNLNQLVALEALLTERNVRRAAERMGVTQSAMSHTLRALRELLGDPLLVRVGNAMVPTEHAQQITGSLRRGLAELETVVRGRAAFDPATVRDEFTLAVQDGVAAFLLPRLYRVLHADAPHARLRVAPFDAARLNEQLALGELDAAIAPPMPGLEGLLTETVLSSGFRALVRKKHPRIRKRLSLAAYCETPHALVTISGEGGGPVDAALEQLGRSRRVGVRVPYLFALPELLATTDLIATVPTPVAHLLSQRWPLRAMPVPVPMPGGSMLLCFHERSAADRAACFFRDRVRRATAELAAQPTP